MATARNVCLAYHCFQFLLNRKHLADMVFTRTRLTRRIQTLSRPQNMALSAAVVAMLAMLITMGMLVQGQVNKATARDKVAHLASVAAFECARAGNTAARNVCLQTVATRQAGERDPSTLVQLSLPIGSAHAGMVPVSLAAN